MKYSSGDIVGDNGLIFKERCADNSKKAIFICPYDKIEFSAYISNVKTGKTKSCGCMTSKLISQKISKDITGQKFGNLTALYSTNKNQNGHIIWECICDCGRNVQVALGNLTSGNSTTCGNTKECSYAYYKLVSSKVLDIKNKKFGRLTPVEFMLDGEYKGLWKCKCDCGNNNFYISARMLLNQMTQSCGCIKSKGEESLSFLLNELNIIFIKQKTFKNCKDKKVLPFDFYLPDYNCCIEYNGIQHYYPTGGWNTKEHFEGVQKRDKIKEEYCKNNNIKLIIFRYDEDLSIDLIKEKLELL